MKWLELFALIILLAATTSCTTLVNRRDLYSPEPGPDSKEAQRQMAGTITTTTTRTEMRSNVTPRDDVPPEFQ